MGPSLRGTASYAVVIARRVPAPGRRRPRAGRPAWCSGSRSLPETGLAKKTKSLVASGPALSWRGHPSVRRPCDRCWPCPTAPDRSGVLTSVILRHPLDRTGHSCPLRHIAGKPTARRPVKSVSWSPTNRQKRPGPVETRCAAAVPRRTAYSCDGQTRGFGRRTC